MIGVFTGIYGSEWIMNAAENLDRQDVDLVRAVFAVNGESSNGLEELLKWQAATRHSVDIVVNKQNLGPIGSWYRNRDLLETPWRAWMHQDDLYHSHHVSTLLSQIELAPIDVVAVFTSMDRLGADGLSRRAGPPLLGPKLNLRERSELFVEVVRQQPFPAPTQCTRSDADPNNLAWYDSGAPDSEWFARLACRGRFMSTFEVTASYRESEESESHTTDWSTRAWLWAQSLQRIIMSNDFATLAAEIPVETRSHFSERLISAISARYPEGKIFEFLKFSAAQRLCETWNYRDGSPVPLLTSTLEEWGISASVRNLRTIDNQSLGGERAKVESLSGVGVELLGFPPRPSALEKFGRSVYKSIGHRVPTKLRTLVFQWVQRYRKRTVSK